MFAFSGIVVAESIKDSVPHRLEPLNQHRLGERYPDIVHDKKTAEKVGDIQILRGFGRLRMFR